MAHKRKAGGESDEDYDFEGDVGQQGASEDDMDDDEDFVPQQQQKQQRKRARKTSGSSGTSGGGSGGGTRLTISLTGGSPSASTCPAKGGLRRDDFGAIDVRGEVTLKPDHENRPIYVTPNDFHLILETFSPIYKQAYDFVIAIAEPVTRPLRVHEYRLSMDSLRAAAAVGIKTEDIIEYLNRLSKTTVPESVNTYIRMCAETFGKVKLVIKQNKYLIESAFPDALQTLLRDAAIKEARVSVDGSDRLDQSAAPRGQDLQISGMAATLAARRDGDGTEDASDEACAAAAEAAEAQEELPSDLVDYISMLDRDDDDEADTDAYSFEVHRTRVETVQRRCVELDYPLLNEYDFRRDSNLKNLEMDLKPTCILRPYQEKSLRKMFGNGRARSGMIVLPCGAGKTLTGVTAACTIKKRAIVLCTSGVAVEQWRSEFVRWTTINPKLIFRFTSKFKAIPARPECIVICTYSMLAKTEGRARDSQNMIDFLRSESFGLLIADEVQTVPANEFRQVLTTVAAHCKLGLTATLVREDNRIKDLNFLFGPKLYEANWIDLQKAGYIANVQCCEVRCPMTPFFYREYLKDEYNEHMKRHIYVTNPIKFQYCEFLVRQHEKAGDKIIVFSDDVFALRTLATKLNKPYIDGPTPQSERLKILGRFKENPNSRTIFCSRIADNSFDLPDANVLIQISSHGASRRQEAQRLGRILRAKKQARSNPDEFNAFFYSLISKDTREMSYSAGRQRFLVDQGYSYKIITKLDLTEEAKIKPFCFSTEREQRDLLVTVLANRMKSAQLEEQEGKALETVYGVRTMTHSLASLSGADNLVYSEMTRTKQKKRNPLFRNRYAKKQ